MKKIIAMASVTLVLNACGNKEREYDATGVFEATETTVYAEQTGALLMFNVEEGDIVGRNKEVGLIDTTQLWLKIQQTEAMKNVDQSPNPEQEQQIAVTRRHQAKATPDPADPLRDQFRKCHILVPAKRTVIEKYVECGEFVSAGKPLFRMADTENMFIRAYVTSAQLKNIKTGQKATVFADYGNGEKKEYEGRVTWISSRSEFTPKTILTDDERADLVYAVKVAIKGDGFVKMGMYGEVLFASEKRD